MAYPTKDIVIVPECNDDNGNPTCWAMLTGITYDISGKSINHYIWISKYSESCYIVENSNGFNLTDGKEYKTLKGAKKKAESVAWRQDETGFFTD